MTACCVLVVDDSEAVREHIAAVLSVDAGRYRVVFASNGLDGFREMVSTTVDLVLCDVSMPVLDGFKFLALKATRPGLRGVPVIMLTAAEDISQKVKALEGGASDYLTKPFHEAELLARVRVHLEMRLLQRELREKNEQLQILSNTDGLTKVTNRRHFVELAEIELLRAAQEELPVAIVLVDVDHFKRVNDKHGHLMGDRVLVGVADVLKGGLREQDVAARYGGEEFVILLPKTDLRGAAAVAERYRRRISEMRVTELARPESIRVGRRTSGEIASMDIPITVKADPSWSLQAPPPYGELHVTASFGVAAFPEQDAETLEGLLRRADDALYKAKSGGRNRVVVAEPDAFAADVPRDGGPVEPSPGGIEAETTN
jgi:diguanylate cyclase (GGDEF)-like protein